MNTDRFFTLSLDMLCIAGTDGFFRRLNPAFEKTLGYSEAELLSQPFIEFVHPEDRERTQTEVERLAARAKTVDFENRYRCKDGSWRWLLWTAIAAPDGSIYAAARDITDRKRAERELQRTVAELQRYTAELEQFAYIASHDLQEPLRAVAGCAQILNERYGGQLDADADELIGHIVDGATRMKRLIGDLLTYSRAGRRALEVQQFSAERPLGTALANLRPAIEQSGARITHGPLPEVRADETQLTQLFQHLIGNAIKFRGERVPEITVEGERRGAEWLFSVRDNGIGIEPRFFDRVFGVFQRLHTQREFGGTGMGLALCKKIVERHGGRIWVESEPGKGSAFFFTLPGGAD